MNVQARAVAVHFWFYTALASSDSCTCQLFAVCQARAVVAFPQFHTALALLKPWMSWLLAVQARAVAVHRRFYTALALHDLVQEVPLLEVAARFNCNKGQLQSLMQSAATFAGECVAAAICLCGHLWLWFFCCYSLLHTRQPLGLRYWQGGRLVSSSFEKAHVHISFLDIACNVHAYMCSCVCIGIHACAWVQCVSVYLWTERWREVLLFSSTRQNCWMHDDNRENKTCMKTFVFVSLCCRGFLSTLISSKGNSFSELTWGCPLVCCLM